MKIKQKIEKELKSAVKEKNSQRSTLFRGLISEIHNQEIEKKNKLTEEETVAVLKNEKKKREDAIEQYQKGGRNDLVKKEKAELKIISSYLPKEMDENKIKEEAKKVIAEIKATETKEMGKVMAVLMPRLKGQADGAKVAKIVTELLKK